MKLYQQAMEIRQSLNGTIQWGKDRIKIVSPGRLRQQIDELVWNAVFNPQEELRNFVRWLIRSCSQELGLGPASIQGLYQTRGRGDFTGFTVPAINIRGLTYRVARSIFRTARRLETAAVIFEIARSEIDYTYQRPGEYATVVLAAAIKESYPWPVFIQGDHFQISAKRYRADSAKEISAVKELIREAVTAGFFNIDIDTSTLVDLSQPTVEKQQELNSRVCAELTDFIRKQEYPGVVISVGGEIGEVGGKNSTEEELRAFLSEYRRFLGQKTGLSKISVQTGTTHGGIPLPDGQVAEVKLDFSTLERLSRVAQQEYGLAGAVQHGASTLPLELFDKFPAIGTAEIHLATEFQNIIYNHPSLPKKLLEEIYNYLRKEHTSERKETDSEQQFLYKTRKRGFGPFKKEFWSLPDTIQEKIDSALAERFQHIFSKLGIGDKATIVVRNCTVPKIKLKSPAGLETLFVSK